MLREIEELDQFRITVQHLEVCRAMIQRGGEAECRSALILLDHVSEVILYRIAQEDIEKDEFTSKVIPERYDPQKRKQIERNFNAKLEAVAKIVDLPELVIDALKILHTYRNAAYHRDQHNPKVLPLLARISFIATADLFARTGAGFMNRGVGGANLSVQWLQPYGLAQAVIWFESHARCIAQQLKAGIKPRLALIKEHLSKDITARVDAVQAVLDEVFERDTVAIDRMFKHYEFRRVHWDLESKLSENLRTLTYKIASGRGNEVSPAAYVKAQSAFRRTYDANFKKFVPKTKYADLQRIREELSRFSDAQDFRTALARYSTLDRKLNSLESFSTSCYHDIEKQAELENDIARGK